MAEPTEWVSVSEAARLRGLSVRTIKRLVAEGQLKSARKDDISRRDRMGRSREKISKAPIGRSACPVE